MRFLRVFKSPLADSPVSFNGNKVDVLLFVLVGLSKSSTVELSSSFVLFGQQLSS